MFTIICALFYPSCFGRDPRKLRLKIIAVTNWCSYKNVSKQSQLIRLKWEVYQSCPVSQLSDHNNWWQLSFQFPTFLFLGVTETMLVSDGWSEYPDWSLGTMQKNPNENYLVIRQVRYHSSLGRLEDQLLDSSSLANLINLGQTK